MSSVIWTGLKKAAGTAVKWVGGGTSSLYLYGALALAGAAAAGGTAWWHSAKVEEGFTRGHAAATAQHLAAENRALLLQAERIATLINVNQEIQRDLDTAQAAAADVALSRVRGAGVRESERAAIVAAAEWAAAGACGRYAATAERHIDGVEEDATAMGLRAAGASATAHALKRTLDERRKAIDAQRQALKPTKPTQE